jgi:AraC-like DNA-binding protein
MSESARRWSKLTARQWAQLGAYGSPFSGTGMEFLPLGVEPPDVGLLLHEVGYLPRRPHWNYRNVFSPFWRLYYDLQPGHRVVFQNREVTLGPDRIVLIPDRQLFHAAGTEPRPKFWIAFTHSAHLVATETIPIQLRPGAAELSLIEDMIKLLRAPSRADNRHRVYHCGIALLHVVLSHPDIRWQTDTPDNLTEVISYIEEHFASALYTTDLAKLANMSETAFRRKFRRFRAVSPAQYIAQTRVREAAHLLAHTNLGLSEIAERSGLANAAYLSRVFKRVTGEAPAQFRHQVQVGLG